MNVNVSKEINERNLKLKFNIEKIDIYENINRLSRYIKASKYVLVILLLFTICWLPWVLVYSVDLVYHQANLHRDAMEATCGKVNYTMVKRGKYQPDIYLCVRNISGHHADSCEVKFSSDRAEDHCGILYEILHERMFENLQLVVICFGALNSLFNPLVYAIWCDVFRRIVKKVTSKIKQNITTWYG